MFSLSYSCILFPSPWQAIQFVHRAEEIVKSSHRLMKEEEGKAHCSSSCFQCGREKDTRAKGKADWGRKG